MNDVEDKALKIFEQMGKWTLVFFIMAALFTCAEKIAKGDPLYGQDYLGIQQKNFTAQSIPTYLRVGTPLGSLYYSFGTSSDNITFLLSHVHPTYYRVHLINATCIRNGNCGPYEVGYGFSKASFDKAVRDRNIKILNFVRDGATLYKRMADNFPTTTFIVSPALEHDLSKEAWRILADTVLASFPNAILDNCPDGNNPIERYKGAWVEKHTTGTAIGNAEIASTDGVDVTDSNIEVYKRNGKNAKILFAWTRSYNLRTQSGPWIDPRARTAAPSNDTLEMLAHIFDDRGRPPLLQYPACKKVVPFRAPWVWKTLSEDYSGANKDPRANKPVVITSYNGQVLQAISKSGQSVGQLALYGTYGAGLFRHYSGYKTGSGFSGYEFEKKTNALSGSPYMWLKNGSQCAGPIIGGLRNGTYR